MTDKTVGKLGKDIDKYLKLKAKITAANKAVKELESKASEMQSNLIELLEDRRLETFGTSIGSVKLQKKDTCIVKDWPKFYKYIIKNNAFELLQKRVGQTAYVEYRENGKKIAGTENMIKKALSIGRKKKV